MRYFLDTEFDGFGGKLLSLALVPEDGSEEFYVVIAHDGVTDPWVERHVVPYFDMVPTQLQHHHLSREAAARGLSAWLIKEHDLQSRISYPAEATLEIVADWPEDISQMCMLLLTGPGQMLEIPNLSFVLEQLPGFSTAANSKVPHNALHDARALREHLMSLDH